jgi:hypothetical protein
LERLLRRTIEFPLEITLASGDRHLLPHPDHAQMHPNTHDLVLYPDEDEAPFSVVINPDQIVSVRTVRRE